MNVLLYLGSGMFLLAFGFLVFRQIVARAYRVKGRLDLIASLLQLAVFAGFFGFPYLYMPQEWAWDWLPNGTWNRLVALVLVATGMVLAFGTMGWFGLRKAFGLQVGQLKRAGPYRFSRNPQMVGGWLMVLGVVFYRPSAYAAGWVLIWVLLGHWMITSEEEHLRDVFGTEYDAYCQKTPRYLLR